MSIRHASDNDSMSPGSRKGNIESSRNLQQSGPAFNYKNLFNIMSPIADLDLKHPDMKSLVQKDLQIEAELQQQIQRDTKQALSQRSPDKKQASEIPFQFQTQRPDSPTKRCLQMHFPKFYPMPVINTEKQPLKEIIKIDYPTFSRKSRSISEDSGNSERVERKTTSPINSIRTGQNSAARVKLDLTSSKLLSSRSRQSLAASTELPATTIRNQRPSLFAKAFEQPQVEALIERHSSLPRFISRSKPSLLIPEVKENLEMPSPPNISDKDTFEASKVSRNSSSDKNKKLSAHILAVTNGNGFVVKPAKQIISNPIQGLSAAIQAIKPAPSIDFFSKHVPGSSPERRLQSKYLIKSGPNVSPTRISKYRGSPEPRAPMMIFPTEAKSAFEKFQSTGNINHGAGFKLVSGIVEEPSNSVFMDCRTMSNPIKRKPGQWSPSKLSEDRGKQFRGNWRSSAIRLHA